MKKFFTLIFFLLALPLLALSPLKDSAGKPSDALVNVLTYFDVKNDGSWPSIQAATQKAWIQKGLNRWQFAPICVRDPEKSYALFSDLGMTQTVLAKKMNYDYAVIMGATLQAVRGRFHFLHKEWDRGVRFSTLVFLTGDRALDPVIESRENLVTCCFPTRRGWQPAENCPSNETEMMKWVFDQMDLPSQWRTMPLVIVDTPKPLDRKRPNTKDTLLQWISSYPQGASALLISQQPFLGRLTTLCEKTLTGFDFDISGEGFSECEYERLPRSTSIILDELARWIYSQSE